MDKKYLYIGIFLVIIIIAVLIYQKQKADSDIIKSQQALLVQNPNAQFNNNSWGGIIQQIVAGTTSNLNT